MHLSKKKIRRLLKMKNQTQNKKHLKKGRVIKHLARRQSYKRQNKHRNANLRLRTMRRIGGVKFNPPNIVLTKSKPDDINKTSDEFSQASADLYGKGLAAYVAEENTKMKKSLFSEAKERHNAVLTQLSTINERNEKINNLKELLTPGGLTKNDNTYKGQWINIIDSIAGINSRAGMKALQDQENNIKWTDNGEDKDRPIDNRGANGTPTRQGFVDIINTIGLGSGVGEILSHKINYIEDEIKKDTDNINKIKELINKKGKLSTDDIDFLKEYKKNKNIPSEFSNIQQKFKLLKDIDELYTGLTGVLAVQNNIICTDYPPKPTIDPEKIIRECRDIYDSWTMNQKKIHSNVYKKLEENANNAITLGESFLKQSN